MDVCRVYLIVCDSLDDNNVYILHQLQELVLRDNNYIALVNEDIPVAESMLFNSWLKCVDTPATPPTPLSRQPICHCITAKELVDSFTDILSNVTIQDNRRNDAVVHNIIHHLLDNTPWGSNECFVIMNTILVTQSSSLLSINTYGWLLRVREWNNSSIYCITSDCNNTETKDMSITWADLSTSLPAYIGPLDSHVLQTLSNNILWKGPVLIPEFKTKSTPAPPPMVLPGLQMLMDSSYPTDLRRAVGLDFDHTHQPSYLELVQVVDRNKIPSIWFSPLIVTLSIDPSFDHTPSAHLLNKLFFSVTDPSALQGVLFRLFTKGLSESQTQCERITSNWHRHILEKEPGPNGIQLSSAISCSFDTPGPLLLLLPSTPPSKSCDAKLLWKPEALMNVAGTYKRILFAKRDESQNKEILNDNNLIKCDSAPIAISNDHDSAHNTLPAELSTSVPNEIIALCMLEAITRKKMKRKNTSELMLGGVVAPPLVNVSTVAPKDMLDCFTDNGTSTRELSPVAMNSDDGPHSLHMIIPTEPTGVSYKKVLSCTPRTARKYHGVNYCFTDEDMHREDKLMTIQSHYVTKERSSYCSNCQSPSKDIVMIRDRKKLNKSTNQSTSGVSSNESVTQTESHSTQSHSYTNKEEGLIKRKRNVRNRTQSTTAIQSRKLVKNVRPRSQTIRPRSQTIRPRSQALRPHSNSMTKNHQNTECNDKTKSTDSADTTIIYGKRKRNGQSNNDIINRENQSDSSNVIETIATKHNLSPTSKKRKESIPLDEEDCIGLSHGKTLQARRSLDLSDGSTPPCQEKAAISDDEGVVATTDDNIVVNKESCDQAMISIDPSLLPSKCLVKDPPSTHNVKKLLEKSVVNVLKDHGLTKGHARFTRCYVRLFKICKIYVQDLQSKSLRNLKQDITRIVESNIQQVIDFELQQNHTPSLT